MGTVIGAAIGAVIGRKEQDGSSVSLHVKTPGENLCRNCGC